MDYKNIIGQYPRTSALLEEKGIVMIEKLDSIWRKENIVLRLRANDGDYVFKQINGPAKDVEAGKMSRLKAAHPEVIPEIILIEGNAYLMRFIDGKTFFELPESERIMRILGAGALLDATYTNGHHPRLDISGAVRASFERYRKKASKYYRDSELRLGGRDFEMFSRVPSQISHNDLNAANLIYCDSGIALIDADEEGFHDIAKDVGRYCASTFFNNYDYFGNDKTESLDIAEAFLTSFDQETLERARYFLGESFVSFINFDTKTTPKRTLKSLAVNLLQGKPRKIMQRLEDGLEGK